MLSREQGSLLINSSKPMLEARTFVGIALFVALAKVVTRL